MKAHCTGFIVYPGPEDRPAILELRDHDALVCNIVLFPGSIAYPHIASGRDYDVQITAKSIKIKAL